MGDDVADAIGGLRVSGRVEAGCGDLLEFIRARGELEELDEQGEPTQAVGLGHLV